MEFVIQGGARIEIPSKEEIAGAVGADIDARERQQARAFKWLRLPQTLTGTIASSAITLGVTKGQVLGPQEGYAWSVMALVVSGLTASSTTPDVVNFYLNDRFNGPPWWQLNGNSFGVTFGKLQRVMMPGDTLALQNSGTIAATGTVTVSGEVLEVPAEQLWKLI